MTELVTRLSGSLTRDPARVLARLFVPGHEELDQESRATGVLARILALPEDVVTSTLADVRTRFAGRHRDLESLLLSHAAQLAHRIPDGSRLSPDRRALLGAYFTHEFSIEAASLCNPSVVEHPDQSGLQPGELRFLLSLRAVGEGHVSSVEFRTGVFGPSGQLRVDEPGEHVESGRVSPGSYHRELFAAHLAEGGADEESTRFLLSRLSGSFTQQDLWAALTALAGQRLTRHGAPHTDELARRIASGGYEVEFSPWSALAERVLWPQAPSESHGIEDVRFVRFVDDDATVTFRATYTAYDGTHITPQAMETTDFLSFRMTQLAGPAAKNKGMALFPRKVGGRYLALSRWDRESCSVTGSDDGLCWDEAETVHVPRQPWEIIQSGNCGSPVETAAGWVVLTHGVGPMREYVLSALLLDLDDPRKVLGVLPDPLLAPTEDEREGYVPNVVYSCGALLHGDQLLLPYGVSDSSVRFASVDLPLLLERLTSEGAATRANSSA